MYETAGRAGLSKSQREQQGRAHHPKELLACLCNLDERLDARVDPRPWRPRLESSPRGPIA